MISNLWPYQALIENDQHDSIETGWSDVGVAIQTKSNGIAILLRPGITVSGHILLLPKDTANFAKMGAFGEANAFEKGLVNLEQLVKGAQ